MYPLRNKMKKILYIAAFFLIFSCESNDDAPENQLSALTTLEGQDGRSYTESIDAWNALKTNNGNSYSYQTTFISFTGFGSITELTVTNNVVTSRIYQEFSTDQMTGERDIIDSFTETGSQLGSNQKGATPLTIDQLYTTCAADYLVVDENENTIYFQTATNGLMTLCGFFPNNCADDCFEGITISAFDWVN